MATLLLLPQELLVEIAIYARHASKSPMNIYGLLLACRLLYQTGLPAIYVDIREEDLTPQATQKLHETLGERPDLRALVQVFQLHQRNFHDKAFGLGSKPPVLHLPNCVELSIKVWYQLQDFGDDFVGYSILDVLDWVSSCPSLVTLCIDNISTWDAWDGVKLDATPKTLRNIYVQNSELWIPTDSQIFWNTLSPWVRELALKDIQAAKAADFGGISAVAPHLETLTVWRLSVEDLEGLDNIYVLILSVSYPRLQVLQLLPAYPSGVFLAVLLCSSLPALTAV